uniref:Uncharacterized protein LOC108053081 n=1 Tax=Drosophila rhopaloa TaxID=1041015 RepID=A0A6P4FNS9_DRORH
MFKFGNFILFAFLSLDYRGDAVPRRVHQSVCLLSDAPNQCGAFTLSALGPLFDDMDELKIRLSESKIQAVQEKVENSIRKVVETEMQAVKNRIDDMDELKTRLSESKIQAVQESVENSIRKVVETEMQAVKNRIQALEETLLNKFESQLNRMQDQLKAELERDSVTGIIKIPPNFELIGSRYFYIQDKVYQDFKTAANTCRKMGGYLASIKDEEELNLIRMKLKPEVAYWLGTNDHNDMDFFVSLASGKPAF